ncbi:MBG domain-containing protein, partial [uncultured Pedobacter sp.]|uniref:beta strand repeat-containing protein n=1 Tax=uncultured Pedobacter sp. TaxID=246139 RepID=UPI0025FE3D40
MMRKFYLLICLLIVQMAVYGQTRTLDFANLSGDPVNGTKLGTTSFTQTNAAQESWTFTMSANSPGFWTYNDQTLWLQSGDPTPTATGNAKTSIKRADGQNFNFKTINFFTFSQDQYIRIEGKKSGVVKYTQNVYLANANVPYQYSLTGWNDLDEVLLTITTNAQFPNNTSAGDFYVGVTSFTYDPSPRITTNAASSITTTSAVFNGNLVSAGFATVTEKGFVYSTSLNPTTADTKRIVAGSALGAYNYNETTLSGSTTYHVRAYAINSVGTAYGVDQQFITPTNVTSVSVPANATYKIGQTLSFTINFSGNVVVTGTPQLSITVGSASKSANYVSGSGSSALTFSYTVASGDLDTDGITIGTLGLNGGTIKDASTNNAILTLNNVASTANVRVDGVAPSVVISSTAGASGGTTSTSPIPFTVTFSESISGLLAGGLTVGNATISGFSGIGTTYTFNATPTANGAVTINIAANVAQDAAGNGNTAASQFSITYVQAVATPTVTALSPTSGPTSGGTSVTITGTNFSGATAVTFGATAATSFTVNSATQITATAPAGTGTVDVRITTTGGTSATSVSDQFTYVAVPTVTALSPTSGPTSGGTSVTITGTDFSGATAVTFGATAATGFTVNSATQITATAPSGTGTVDVLVTTTGGTSATSANDQFTYVATPTVTALSPTSGSASGGTSVTITGTNFSGATVVTFGTKAATSFTINSATQITATAPAGTGTVDVRITTRGGTSATSASNQFTYVAVPTVTALSPTSGPTGGGTSVTITGTDFNGATAVTFGATAATSFTVNSATQITATAPAGTGTVDVRITTTGGTSATNASDQFTYVATPTVTALSPTSGPTGGGTSVTITGTNFSGATAVTFGATAATSFTVNSATQITATSPAGTGTVDVRITTTGGTTATSAADQFTYIAAPTVTALSPTSGPTSGGTSVTITGTNFSGTTAVNFGATASTGFTVNSATQITATAPAGTGTVDVRITTAGGTSATSAADQFTYIAAPTITVTGTLSALTTTYGTASSSTSFTVSGVNMTAGILVSPPAAFEVSTDNITFSNTVIAGSAGVISQVVYVRLKNTAAANTYAGTNVTLSSAGAANVTTSIPGSTVAPLAIAITAAAKSKTYGDADPALTYTFAPALVTGDSFSGSLTRLPGENVGTYAINQGTLALNSNYTVTYVGADLTIGAKTITVTAAAKSKTYGDADPALTYTFAPALLTGDSFSGSLTRTPGENVGTYAISQGTLAVNSNYTVTYVGADLTIGAKSITVTAAAKSKTYGDADPALTYTFAPALVTGDSFSGSLTRTPGENVGIYAINQGTLALNSNYTVTYVGADLTIGAKSITVTAAAKSKTYGDADPALTYTFAPALVTGNSFSGSLTRTPGENVGTYAINQGTLALNSNYTVTYVGADLTIGAKTITVTAAAKSKTYGDADPALTYTFAPALVGTDTFTGSLTRTSGENVGTYAINQGTLALNGNYSLTY